MSQNSTVFPNVDEDRIQELITQMTVKEKAYQLNAYYFGSNIYSNANLRLGIPNLSAGECLSGVMANRATRFPQAIAMASTWDPILIESMGAIVAKEARAFGIHQCYSPMLSVVRDVRWGRIEESYGEDPFLVGKIGAAYIRGLQGTGEQRFDKNHVLACAKHFVADGEPMAGANGAAMDVSDYNLHNVHMYPFKLAIEEAKVSSLMPAHHLLNGIPCHANQYIFNDILRNQYNWDGYVVSDNQDLVRLVNLFNYADNFTDAANKSLVTGVHQELDLRVDNLKRVYSSDIIEEGLKNGIISEEILDNAVAANLRAKFALGLFESEIPTEDMFIQQDSLPPMYYANHFGSYRNIDTTKFTSVLNKHEDRINWKIINDDTHDKLALEVARKSIILLKNENDILPINLSRYRKIAVIGPNADVIRLGGYTRGEPKYFVTILEGIRKHVGDKSTVSYAEGSDIDTEQPLEYDSTFELELTRHAETRLSATDSEDGHKITEAVELARNSDLVILAIGGSEATTRENEDTDYLGLRGSQMELVRSIHATGTPVVVVLLGGRPLSINWITDNIPGIIQGWYLGQETGTAIADVLFGKINPGGKLPVTVPRNAGQLPLFYNKLETGRPRRIYRSSSEPLFPFGYGLSYTTFKLDNIKLEKNQIEVNDKTVLSIDIQNMGDLPGDEVVQLYVRAWNTKLVRPKKELKGFQRVFLESGQKKRLYFEIGKQQLEYWNNHWVVESGKYTLYIGTDSSDEKLLLNNIELTVKQ